MILRLLLTWITIIILPYKINSADQMCFVLCDKGDCDAAIFNKCNNNCPSFLKQTNWASSNFECRTEFSTSRYQPVGKTSDITNSITNVATPFYPLSTLTINASSSGTAIETCDADSPNVYKIYGYLYNSDNFTISHPGVTLGRFWAIRLRLWMFTVDRWSDPSQVTTTFTTDPTASPRSQSLKQDQMAQCKNACSGSRNSQKQCYDIIDQQFVYNKTTTSLNFILSVSGNTPIDTPWGVKQVLIYVRTCDKFCLTCFGDSNSQCWSCVYDGVTKAMLSENTYCRLTCRDKYGFNQSEPSVCLVCSSYCKSCYNDPYNCTSCLTGAYLYAFTTPNVTCVLTCPAHSLPNNSTWKCDMCNDNCGNCLLLASTCITCNVTWLLYNNTCYNPSCPPQTYNNTATTCAACMSLCYTCSGSPSNCTVCDINGTKAFLHATNNTCVTQCGIGFFQNQNLVGVGPNQCTACDTACQTCNFNSTYCFICKIGNYLYNFTCGPTCTEPGYFADDVTRTCLLCNVFCVGLSIKAFFSNNLKEKMICELTFTEDLNWTNTQVTNFVTITQNDPVLTLADHFIVTYEVLSPRKYRINVQPKGYIFIYNITFNFQTDPMGGTVDRAINARPFKIQNYGLIASIKWFLIKAPSMSDTQKMVVDKVANMSQTVLQFTTLPFIQQIKKTGIFGLLLGGAQATSLSCLVNSIPSQNLYEGARLWASFVYFDVPEWQTDSNRTKFVVIPDVKQMIKNARLLSSHQQFLSRTLFDSTSLQWRFNRTGHTSFFIFDVYMNIALIVFCWVLILIANCCIQHKIKYKKYLGKFYSFTMKVHQLSIFYITLTTLLQWIYFDAASAQRWTSFIMCICFNIYFFCFQLYIYYDMIKYPRAQIGNQTYEYYCLKYGSILKNIRFEQHDPAQTWSPKHWFRPYNYHIMSYYKKFLMLISLPIFYYTPHAQICVLILLQIFQVIRYLVVWPFKSRIRNFIRLSLDFILLVFFSSIFVQGFAIIQIMKTDPATLQSASGIFYNIGWLGFASCWAFNIGFIIIIIYDIVTGCRKTNRQLMDQARKIYYMQKLNSYEQQNQDVPLSLINKWVKLGNLNNRKYDQLPDINIRLQCYKIMKSQKGYQVQMKKLTNLFMNAQFNYQNDNNISAAKKYNKRFTLNKALSPQFYNTVHSLYQKYSNHLQFQYLTIKTFQKIMQANMKAGQKIVLKPEQMFQKIELQTYAGQTKIIKLDKILNGFPIDQSDLKNII